ncbi:MAG: hypothetical protein Ta2A_04700 [Treponemataceae bacterium]|nr:MAG: hypothetical protein Ta2A_04700 [Treponemataceae bacterium]
MEPTVEFIDSAFMPGYNEESIRHAIRTKIHAMKYRSIFYPLL